MPTPVDLNNYGQMFNQNTSGFMNSAPYMLNYGNNKNPDPAQRYLEDKGTQMELQQGLNKVSNTYAAMGLGQSGALARGLQDASYAHYSDWMNNQNNMFNGYLNSLGGLAQFGQSVNGADLAANNSRFLAQLLSQNYMTNAAQSSDVYGAAGQALAGINTGLGTNLASLQMATAAAKANNMFNAYNLMYQLQSANAASNAGSLSSAIGGAGYAAAGNNLQNVYPQNYGMV